MKIRSATPHHMAQCEAIYAHHIARGVGTFDEASPQSGVMEAKRSYLMGKGYPFLIAEDDGQVLGYAYAGPFRTRSAYRFAAEDSIYLDPNYMGKGLAKPLLNLVIDHTRRQGLKMLVAVIGMNQDQELEAHPSVRAHAKVGFRPAGCLNFVGYKFDRWLKTAYMELDLKATAFPTDALTPPNPK